MVICHQINGQFWLIILLFIIIHFTWSYKTIQIRNWALCCIFLFQQIYQPFYHIVQWLSAVRVICAHTHTHTHETLTFPSDNVFFCILFVGLLFLFFHLGVFVYVFFFLFVTNSNFCVLTLVPCRMYKQIRFSHKVSINYFLGHFFFSQITHSPIFAARYTNELLSRFIKKESTNIYIIALVLCNFDCTFWNDANWILYVSLYVFCIGIFFWLFHSLKKKKSRHIEIVN